MKFVVEIELGNDGTQAASDVACPVIQTTGDVMWPVIRDVVEPVIRDVNGNQVGTFGQIDE
jgi:hypothetical protein